MGLNNTTIKVDSKQVDRILESITGDSEQIDPQVYTESLSQDESAEQKITVTDLSKDSTGDDTVTVIPIEDEQDVEGNDYKDTQVLPNIQTGGKEQQYQYISNERIEDNNTDFIEQGFDPKAKTYQEVNKEVDSTSKEVETSEVGNAVNTQDNKDPSKNSIERANKFTNNNGLVDKQLLKNIENTIAEGLKDDAIDKAVENIDAALKNQEQYSPVQKSDKLKIEGKHFHLTRTSCKMEKENDPTGDQNSPTAVITNEVETTTNTQWVDNSNTDAIIQQNLQRNGGNSMQTQTIKGNNTKLQTNNRIKNTAKALGKTQPKNQNLTATIADYTNNHVQQNNTKGLAATDTQTTGKLRQQIQAKQDRSGKQDKDEDLKEFSADFARQSSVVESDANLDAVTAPNDTYKALDISVLNATREQLVNIDDNLLTDVNFTPSKFVAEIQQGMSEEDTFAPINALFNSEGLTVFTKYREQVMTYNLCTKLYDNLKSTGQRYIYTAVNYKDIIQLPKNIDFLGEVDIEDTHYYIFAFIDIPNCFNQTIRKPLLDIIDLILEAIKTLQYSVAQDVEVPLTSQYGVPILTNAEIKGIITSLNNYHVNVSVDDCYTLTIRL